MTHKEFRTKRKSLKLTQREVAEALDVGSNTVARWERGELPISRVVALAFSTLRKYSRIAKPTRAKGL